MLSILNEIMSSWIHFKNVDFFYLLIILIPALIFIEFKNKKFSIKFKDIELLNKFFNNSWIILYFKLILKLIILIIFITILVNPWLINIKQEITKKWVDIALVLDLSKSMLAEDILPNRIESAKKVLIEFISKLENDRLSLIIFAWKPFVSVPLTFDKKALIEIVKNISTDTINQNIYWLSGTAIWDSIIIATDALDKENINKNREQIIILITDWEANIWIDPKISTKYSKEKWIKIFTIWIWSNSLTPLFTTDKYWNKKYFMDNSWDKILSKIDEETLEYIAKNTNWKYFNANSENALIKIFKELEKLNKTEIKTKTIEEFYSLNHILLIILIILITINLWLIKKFKFIN